MGKIRAVNGRKETSFPFQKDTEAERKKKKEEKC